MGNLNLKLRYHDVSNITFAMEPSSLLTEIVLTHPQQSLGTVHLDWIPQPGAYLDLKGQVYTVLERRHRYHLKSGRYQIDRMALYVQPAQRPIERSLIDGYWVLGDATCRFNARSELLRCAVNPMGPCDHCRFFEPGDAANY